MAKKKRRGGLQNTFSIDTESFNKGMVKDLDESLIGDGSYTHARNAVNNSKFGNIGIISNESSNRFCAAAPYTVIGAIHLYADMWVLFSTDNTDSEVGTFDESSCTYTTVVNDQCLNFHKNNPIIGESKENFDCTWQVYWADNRNPDRRLNVDNPAWIQDCQIIDDCESCTDTDQLDCEAIRMARLTTPPCLKIRNGLSGGELLNGSYQAVIAYTENGQRVSDYSLPTNVLSIFDHRNVNGSIDVEILDIDETFEEFELVIVSFVNEQTVATRMGIYSTNQRLISIDRIPANAISVPLEFIPLDVPSYERSEGIYNIGDYLTRVAPTTRFSFNYQPLANQIRTRWVSVEYPEDYYLKAGVNPSLLRDEVYSFFIRWVYNTNDKSDSYHIPGKAPGTYTPPGGTTVNEDDLNLASPVYGTEHAFEKYNTAEITQGGLNANLGTTDDGGIIRTKGTMGYWESSERYPDNKPEVWGTLCGKPIRHHKMPDNILEPHFNEGTNGIRVLGVEFENILFPVDNDGQPIPGIIGYEILRGSREGNKTILAKGMINNMGAYIREDNNELALYQNYPYNDLRHDPFLSTDVLIDAGDVGNSALGNNELPSLGGPFYKKDRFTFHSPDTQFKYPFLSAQELKSYGLIWGRPEGKFVEPYLHPRHKIFTDFGLLVAGLVGFGTAMVASRGTQKTTVEHPTFPDSVHIGNPTNLAYLATAIPAAATAVGLFTGYFGEQVAGTGHLQSAFVGNDGDLEAYNASLIGSMAAAAAAPGVDAKVRRTWDSTGATGMPLWLRVPNAVPTLMTNWSQGTDAFIRVIKAFSKFRQFAVAYESHCFYQNYVPGNLDDNRFGIEDAAYLSNRLQEFAGNTINNLFRGSCVAIATDRTMCDPIANPAVNGNACNVNLTTPRPVTNVFPTPIVDSSRQTANEVYGNISDLIRNEFNTVGYAMSHYVALKSRLRNQYGQIEGIIQIPSSACMQEWEVDINNPPGATSKIIFPGDTYIARYTEKNPFFFFSDWMFDQPDGFEYNYLLRRMMPYPTYWMDTQDYQANDFVSGLFTNMQGGDDSQSTDLAILPSQFHNFDRGDIDSAAKADPNFAFMLRNAVMYLFNSGVRDFFVESEYNIAYRDWGEPEEERHYDPYKHTDLSTLFRTDYIKAGNFFKYDYSLGVSRYYQAFGGTGWGSVQRRDYDPEVAETCYSYYPNRLIYSLPQETEQIKDNWLVYLVNNYKDFLSKITNIKSIGKNGAMMLFEREAPLQIQGVDTLQTTGGTKITLGDGGLFNQATQNLVNTDRSYEYGSCQNRLSVINTPAGLFWISQNQGKIFNYTGKLEDISQQNLKWWFNEYLPYKILEDFPDFELVDNTIVGVGCQSIYDNENGTVYFTKRDFKAREEWVDRMTYEGGIEFLVDRTRVLLGDPTYFEDASWTVSYDPKQKQWVSYHDWHPNLLLPSKNHFMSVLDDGVWKHNNRSDSYCNFYGVDYPFEVETVMPTGQTTNTLKSIEYMLEVYEWDAEGVDKHHVLDFNFDRAVVHNSEQISGDLRLNLMPKNNIPLINSYPIVTPTGIEILYSKEEHKYRFNQFWDITLDRGEFTNARNIMWDTDPNGYTFSINPGYIDYNKPELQRKKFRHYYNKVWLRRLVSGQHNMHMKLINTKNQYSLR